jgi:hypothetical protein
MRALQDVNVLSVPTSAALGAVPDVSTPSQG